MWPTTNALHGFSSANKVTRIVGSKEKEHRYKTKKIDNNVNMLKLLMKSVLSIDLPMSQCLNVSDLSILGLLIFRCLNVSIARSFDVSGVG